MTELRLAGGRTLAVHATEAPPGAPAVVWHHGTPQTGAPLDPLVEATRRRGLRLVSYARPGYGGSTPCPGRDVAAAAADVAAVADHLGLERFAVMGASGGGPHALACAARLGERITAAVTLASPAPYSGDDAWFAGMRAPQALRAAVAGRAARLRHAETATFDTEIFTAGDWAALEGPWQALAEDAGRAGTQDEGGRAQADDDLAFAAPWGFELREAEVPVLVVHGGEDRVIPPAHAELLVRGLPRAELWLRPRDGHVSVLEAVPAALDWVLDRS